MIKGAIFDMDGVLVDNAVYHIRAWRKLGIELGRDLTDEQVRRVFGQRNSEMLKALVDPSLTSDQAARYGERKEIIYRELISPYLTPVPGLVEFLGDLKTRDFRTAVATSGPNENVDLVMDGLALRRWFDAIVTGSEVAHGKPEPDIFLLAARRLSLEARECVVFEDSTAGIEAALRAGSVCVALATTHSPEALKDYPTFRVIRDFRGLRAADLFKTATNYSNCTK